MMLQKKNVSGMCIMGLGKKKVRKRLTIYHLRTVFVLEVLMNELSFC